ncbi:glycoside hydrolase family 31 protein [Collybiopsis luxurians FD-317 M1]|uniref:beta-glucosidase n=1 Tax=Collybiopsis luxurians FD-317 M1 TaxID=944289 RepID=A0A0D0AND0_9AGAR|nr:glycoside hydrolase family 31 protein [Collybiopsis luxurians FD-317 M1]
MIRPPYAGFLCAILLAKSTFATWIEPSVLDACPGYKVQNPVTEGAALTADLVLAGKACNVFGNDLEQLKLAVTYETENRIHVKITDANSSRYEVPDSVLPRPNGTFQGSPSAAAIQFNYTTSPFSFTIFRTTTREVLFTTANHPVIFEPQYLRVKTALPPNANIYGLGEHTDSFRLPTFNTTRTLWSRDAYEVPTGTNLYGNHPIYFEHRSTGTHGVFLLNSNGMDIKINDTESTNGGVTLEYNVLGGVLDFYFLAGSEEDPLEVSRQYAEIVGTPAEVPYWSFGLHQCRFGYTSFVDVANVITNYSAAEIPLETMWTDIDYMQGRRIFTVDPSYFPLPRMREIVQYLHAHNQKYILMTDPAVAYAPGEGYGPYDRGTQMDIWMKMPNGSAEFALVWPGVTHYPDWFHPDVQDYWTNEFRLFYNATDGIDIDGAWIDMNEPSNFCDLPCTNPFQQAQQMALPPPRTAPVPDPNTPIFGESPSSLRKRDDGINLLNPPYAIENAAGDLSSKTSWTNATHANGLVEYDTHNLYGTMMSVATRDAMLARRPGLRTLVITRSTFAGAGAHVGKWLGDNFSSWGQYRLSIAGVLGMAGIFQIPMVGADICGYAENTTSTLCARWAMLGGFYPFMRNHNADTSISQEFYRWPVVAQAARNVLNIRYRLMDYFYTAFHQANIDGSPVVQALWYKYPKDAATYPVDLQFLFGPSILVSPVTEENSTSVTIYLPKDTFYDFQTLAPVIGTGSNITLNNIDFTEIPVYIIGGSILPLRANGTMTTTELRQTDFELIVAPGSDGTASGQLYADDGVSLEQANGTTSVTFGYQGGTLSMNGTFGFDLGVNVASVKILGVAHSPKSVSVVNNSGHAVRNGTFAYDAGSKVLQVPVGIKFDQEIEVRVQGG